MADILKELEERRAEARAGGGAARIAAHFPDPARRGPHFGVTLARGRADPVAASLDLAALAETGKLYDFTVVHRSFPGVKTPFVDAIVG